MYYSDFHYAHSYPVKHAVFMFSNTLALSTDVKTALGQLSTGD